MILKLNEKIWFGKYKGYRLFEIIDKNPKYISKLIEEYNVNLSDDVLSYLKKRKGSKESLFFSYDITGFPPDQFTGRIRPI
jgi:hypothetical protein